MPFPTPNMDVSSLLNPIPRLARRPCNKAYSLEQIHFIQYCQEDLKLSWPNTEAKFNLRFPDPARDVSIVGLQCRYYRAQIYPVLDIEGCPVRNDDGAIIMRKMTKRERNQKTGLIVPILNGIRRPMYNESGRIIMRKLTEYELRGPVGKTLRAGYQKYFKLVDRVPTHVVKYDWVKNEDKAVARRNAKYNQDHGIELPGAVLPGGKIVDVVVWEGEIAYRKAVGESPEE